MLNISRKCCQISCNGHKNILCAFRQTAKACGNPAGTLSARSKISFL